MSDVFKAIADPTRREILMTLAQRSINVKALSHQFKMSRPAVSKHIKILKECNLIRVEVDAIDTRQRNCFAQLEALKEVEYYLQELEKFWQQKLSDLGKYLDEQDEEDRKK